MARKNDYWIQESLDHPDGKRPGRAREYVKRMIGDKGFDKDGDMKPKAIREAKAIARRNGDVSMEDSLDEALTLKKLGWRRIREKMRGMRGRERREDRR